MKIMIDLHLHLDGSLRPETVWELLTERNINEFDNIDDLKKYLQAPYDCRDLNDYLKCFDLPIKVLQKEQEIIRNVKELCETLGRQKVNYAEIRFAPMFSMKEGLSMDAVVEAAIEGVRIGERDAGIKTELILCCMRGADESDNMATVECARKYYGNKVCALDLAGAEGLFPTELYEEVFKKASKYDIPFTIHAGEAAGPESIRKALSYGAARIGHGVRCVEDETLMEELAKKEIPLEVCPTSNMQTKVFGSVNEYPLKTILARGVHATLNTDNMTVSGTDLAREKSFCIDTLKLTEKDIELMSQYSIKAAFNY